MARPKRPGRQYRPGLDDPRYHAARTELKRTGNHICHRCGYPIDLQLHYPHPLSWTADHVIPRSQLAPHDPRHWAISNLIEAHKRCNESRGAKPLTPPTTPEPSIDW